MGVHNGINFRTRAAATILLLLALLASTTGCNILHPSLGADGFVHQPITFQQREALITPDNPLVLQALSEALNPAPPVTTTVINGISREKVPAPAPTDFALIIDWVNAHCAYIQDTDAQGISDYWQTPAESIELGAGDCEDYSILLCSLFRAYGAPDDEVYVVVGEVGFDNVHAWVVERYSTGIWLLHDSNPGSRGTGMALSSSAASSFKSSYCFNDTTGFNGEPVLPTGVFEFESAVSTYPFSAGAADSFSRYLNTGEEISVRIDWLPYSVEWPFNPLIIMPWSMSIYAENGDTASSWNGTDLQKTLSYTAAQGGTYRLEVVKRDELARPCRLTIAPAYGWKAANQKAIPAAGKITRIKPLSFNTAAAWQDDTPHVSAPVEVSHETLIQHALGALNTARVAAGLQAIAPGTNTAAQAHADDMAEHRFVSGWGTDGSLPEERYVLAGGLGISEEIEQASGIEWQGNTALFESALLSCIEKAVNNAGVYNPAYSYSNGAISYTRNPDSLKLQPDRVNIGVAYDGENLYFVLQYESVFSSFSQLPAIHNGELSFTCETAAEVNSLSISISYRRLPGPLTAAQISYASGSRPDIPPLIISYSEQGINAFIFSNYPSAFIDPRIIPPGLPPLEQADLNSEELKLTISSASSYFSLRSVPISKDCLSVDGNSFSMSLDLGELMESAEEGIYIISAVGVDSTPNSSHYTYTTFFEYAVYVY